MTGTGKGQRKVYRNRIVRTGQARIADILFSELNWRIHPKLQQEALHGVLEEIGFVQDVLINLRTSPEWGANQNVETLVDGHLRVLLADKHGEEFLPAGYVDLTPDEERKVLLTLDPLAAMAAADKEKLDGLLREVSSESAAVQAMLAEIAEKEGIRLGRELPAPEAQIDRAAELQEKWQVTTGSVWEAGEQRLICGDCTDRATVERLMRGEKGQVSITSPPYPGVTMWEEIWPGMSIEQCHEWLGQVWGNCYGCVDDMIINIADTEGNEWNDYLCAKIAARFGWRLIRRAIWYKSGFLPAGITDKLALAHEFILWFSSGSGFSDSEYIRAKGQHSLISTVFAVPFERERLHKSPYPIELVEQWLQIWSRKGDIVLDPFLGSGTTLVACQRLGRRGRGVEIHPPYVAVCCQRLQDMGLEVKRVEDGHSITSPP